MKMDRYKELLGQLYCEPKDEEILGTFLLKILEPKSSISIPPPKSKKEEDFHRLEYVIIKI